MSALLASGPSRGEARGLVRTRVLLVLAVAAAAASLVLWRPWARSRAPGVRTLVLVTLDTTRRDHVGTYAPTDRATGVPDASTPNLDRLAASGVRFDDAMTPVPLTLPAHTAMLSGLPPAATGVRVNAYGRIPDASVRGFALLPESLAAAGWKTGAFVSASPLARRYGLDHGFGTYDDGDLEDPHGLECAERAGAVTVDRALAWLALRTGTERVFLWVHLFEPHAPYAPEAPAGLPADTRYRLDVARADAAVGRLLEGLAARGRGDAAVLVVADHGEALDELGEKTHGILLGDAVLRVPMLLRAPGLLPGVRTDPADLADVAPTLAHLANLPWDPHAEVVGHGQDLLRAPAPADRVRVAESLYANQLHGWAQLLAATGPDGGTLVDAGADRLRWLVRAPFGDPQAAPGPPGHPEGLARLGDALRRYRQGERADRIQAGDVPSGYSAAARVAPFLDPVENARRPDPYASIDRHFLLDREKERLLAGASPTDVVNALERLAGQDPHDMEVRFWIGNAWAREAARRDGSGAGPAEVREALGQAEASYVRALENGRRDPTTLVLAAGTNARDREAEMLDRLDRWAPEVEPDYRVPALRARLLESLGRTADAGRAWGKAETLTRSPSERRALERLRHPR